MLNHKLRSEEDAILVGRITDEREHPLLNVRHWVGTSPRRMVLDSKHPLDLDSLYRQGIQSLIVEGGLKTLEYFLEQNLWDEIRVETNTKLTVPNGTLAPMLQQANVSLISTKYYGDNMIQIIIA